MIGKSTTKIMMIIALLMVAVTFNLVAQGTHTARPLGSTASPYGYYEYLPLDYAKNSNDYPVVIFLHGSGEKGNGTTQLAAAIKHGPGKEIKNGRNFPFILVSPQSSAWWNYNAIDDLIEFVKTKYRVDASRIYMTGLSMGGISTYRYVASHPDQVAAIVPIAAEAEGVNSCTFSHIPTWAFHGDADNVVSYAKDVRTLEEYNACSPAPALKAKMTTYPGVGHDSWTRTYSGSAGYDIYSWMLQFRKGSVTKSTSNTLPIANAGSDKNITLPLNYTTLQGSASDADGSIQAKSWTKLNGPSVTMSGQSTLALKLTYLVAGTYKFRLTVTDNAGATKYDDVTVIVNPAPAQNVLPVVNTGSDKNITLPLNSTTLYGSASDADGSIQTKQWTKLNGPSVTMSGQSTLALGLDNLVAGTYNFRLTVTDNDGATKYDDIIVLVNPEPTPEPETIPGTENTTGLTYLVNFNYSNNADSPWNNFDQDPDPQGTLSNLKAETGESSTIKMTLLTPWGWQADGGSGANSSGSTTGNNSGAFPDQVMQTSFWTQRSEGEKIQISGLNTEVSYTLVLFGSRSGTAQRTTLYSAGGKSAKLVNTGNTKNTVTLSDIKPNASGVIELNVAKTDGSAYAYLNTMKLIENGPASVGSSQTSDPVAKAAPAKYLINFNETGNMASPWNNFAVNPDTGDKLSNIKDAEGNVSPISLELLSPWGWQTNGSSGIVNGGMTTGNNSGAYPDNALKSAFWTQRVEGEQIKVTGLDAAKKYSFTFMGSRNGSGDRTSEYTIGNTTVSLNASYNTDVTVNIQGVQPNGAGEIIITVTKGANASFAYLNAMTIQEGTTATTESYASNSMVTDNTETDALNLELVAYPNPTTDYITVRFGEGFSSTVNVELISLDGQSVLNQRVDTNEGDFKLDLTSGTIKEGMYVLKVQDGSNSQVTRIIKN